jgi:hypothetical protein
MGTIESCNRLIKSSSRCCGPLVVVRFHDRPRPRATSPEPIRLSARNGRTW